MTVTVEPPRTEVKGVTTEEPQQRRWPWYVAGAAAVLLLVVAGLWVSASTVSVGDYDEVVADLQATHDARATAEDALAAAQGEVSTLSGMVDIFEARNTTLTEEVQRLEATNLSLRDDLADEQARAQTLSQSNADLGASIADARDPVRAIAFMAIDFDESNAADFLASEHGAFADELVGALGLTGTFEDRAGLVAAMARDAAIYRVDDPALTEAYTTWLEADPGSDEELHAFWAMWMRLIHLAVEALGSGSGV